MGTKSINPKLNIMKTIDEIIKNKQNGIDCSEEESAEIKGFVKENARNNGGNTDTIIEIQYWLPMEYDEALSEIGL